jgi:gliding motility-associated-like protein
VRVETPDGCQGGDTVAVRFVPGIQPQLPQALTICPGGTGGTTLFTEFVPGATYIWTKDGIPAFTGTNLNRIVVNAPAVWGVSITTTGGCGGTATTNVGQAPPPLADFLPSPGSAVVLATTNPVLNLQDRSIAQGNTTIGTYNWFYVGAFGDTVAMGNTPNLSYRFPAAPDTFQVFLQVTTQPFGCFGQSQPLRVFVRFIEEPELPTAFSPNNDRVNDVYEYDGLGFEEFSFQIFNRWGRLVYEKPMNANKVEWDGKDQRLGEFVKEDVYIYVFDGKPRDGRAPIQVRGSITLIR